MSQHLITQYINQGHIFKPLNGAKLTSPKLKKYDASNRHNNNSPEDIAESLHPLQKIEVQQEKSPDRAQKATASNAIIDIIV